MFTGKNILFLLLLMPLMAFSQFEVKDTVCIGEMISITNNSRDAATYYWTFCSGNLYYPPEGERLPGYETLSEPAFIDFAEEDGEWFSFITNHNNGTLTRNSYGSDILSTPISENLGDFGGIIPQHAQGVQIVNDGGNWYVYVIGGQGTDSRLVRLSFGNSLSNQAVAEDFGDLLGHLNTPIDLYIIEENDLWYGFTVNYSTSRLTRIEFGPDLSARFTGAHSFTVLLGLNGPTGLFPIQENGEWYFFVSNYSSHEITRLDLGPSLTGYPEVTNIGDRSILEFPFDLTILRDCEGLFGFVLNRFKDIVRMDFNQGIDQPPEFVTLGDPDDVLYNPHGISEVFRVGDTLYTFVANIDNSTIARLYFPGCDNASPSSSTEEYPPEISYNSPGNYNIQLVLDEGTLQQENYCQNVVVLESPEIDLGNDTLLPPGETLVLDGGEQAAWQWSTGETTQTIEITGPGTYTIIVTNEYGCTATDEILVDMEVGIPNFFTPNNDGVNDNWEIPYLSNNPEANIYIYDRFGNLITTYLYGEGGWDGTRNGEALRPDTYWYVIKISKDTKPLKGSITLKR